jgi:hypothetical protein
VADEVRVTSWVAFEGHLVDSYRIWQRLTPFGMFQAHEWRRRGDGNTYRERWIPSAGRSWAKGSAAVADPDPCPLRAALQLIADGHNDPRAVARQALDHA